MRSHDEEIAILRATVAALRATRGQSTSARPALVRPRWHFLAVAFAVGFVTGATLIALTR